MNASHPSMNTDAKAARFGTLPERRLWAIRKDSANVSYWRRAQPIDATRPFVTGRGLKPKAFLQLGLTAIRCCTCSTESDQGKAFLAVSTGLTSSCYCVASNEQALH